MNLNDLIDKYKKAIEQDKVLEGQYQLLSNQLSKALTELGMSYDEAITKEKELREYLTANIPKMEEYISAVEDKKRKAEESFV